MTTVTNIISWNLNNVFQKLSFFPLYMKAVGFPSSSYLYIGYGTEKISTSIGSGAWKNFELFPLFWDKEKFRGILKFKWESLEV